MPVVTRGEATGPGSVAPYRADCAEELAAMGTWQLDLASGQLTSTTGMRRVLGLLGQVDDPTLRIYRDAVHPEDREQVAREWRVLVRDGCEFRSDHRLLLRGGHLKYIRAVGCLERNDEGWPVFAYGMTLDVSDLRLVAREVERERDLSRTILSILREGYVLARSGVILEVNDALCAITGYSRDELVGTGMPYPFWPREQVQGMLDVGSQFIASNGESDLRLVRRDGSLFDAHVTATVLPGSGLSSRMWVLVLRDISEQREYERQLLTRAETDPLTGLLNSRTFRDNLRIATKSAQDGSSLSLALLDVDHFKQVNDRFGHPVGDQVLIALVQRFVAATGTAFSLARVGGEEFALLMPGTTTTEAHQIVETGLQALRRENFPVVGRVTASAGVAELVDEMNDDALYRLADANLYEAKRRGRDRVC